MKVTKSANHPFQISPQSIQTLMGGKRLTPTYKTHTDVSQQSCQESTSERSSISHSWQGGGGGLEGRLREGRAAYQAVHDANTIRVHGECFLVQLLGLFKAALHLSQPASHVEHRVRGGEEASSLLDAETCFLELSLLHEQLSCGKRGVKCEQGDTMGSGPSPRS